MGIKRIMNFIWPFFMPSIRGYSTRNPSHSTFPLPILHTSKMQIPETIKLEEQQDSHFPQLYVMPSYPISSDFLHASPDEKSYSEHNLGSFNALSTAPSSYQRQVPLARSIRGTERHALPANHIPHRLEELETSPSQIDRILTKIPSLLPIPCFRSAPPSRPHIPRPPNAFMLFRSDFLRKGVIPSHIERRQQNLSRIAGQCWNLLPVEEKEKWQEKAAKVLMEHQKQNPNYKFTPAPRGSRRTKSKGRGDAEGDAHGDEDRIRRIREEYTQLAGPTALPARRRRARTQSRHGDKDKETTNDNRQCQAARIPLPPSTPSTPSTPSLPSPGQITSQGPALPPFFPQYSVPHVATPRRPSTSLGFSTHPPKTSRTGFHITRPSSAASSDTDLSTYLRDLDITPTCASFGNNSIPSAPLIPMSPMTPMNSEQHFSDALRDALPFTALNRCGTSSSELTRPPLHWDEDSNENNSESLLGTLYSGDSFPLVVSFHDNQEYTMFEESYFPSTFGTLMPEEWAFNRSLLEVDHTYGL